MRRSRCLLFVVVVVVDVVVVVVVVVVVRVVVFVCLQGVLRRGATTRIMCETK